jgi:hypothetical protein
MPSENQGIQTIGAPDESYEPNVDYWEDKNSPHRTLSADGQTMRRVFFLVRKNTDLINPFHYEETFCQQLLGYPFMNGGVMNRWLPDVYQGVASVTGGVFYLFATQIESIEPIGPLGQSDLTDFPVPMENSALSKITVVYTTLPYDVLDIATTTPANAEYGRFVVKTAHGSAEYLSGQPGFAFIGSCAPPGIPGGVGRIVGMSAVDYVWFDVHPSGFDRTKIEGAFGKVNVADFDPGAPTGRAYPAQTLLLISADFVPKRGPTGDRLYTITMHFAYKSNETHGWNWLLDIGGTWQQVVRLSDCTTGIYLTFDFTTLFTP